MTLPEARSDERELEGLTSRVLDRTTGGRAIPGNAVRLLVDGPQAYPAMLGVIEGARQALLFENYIVRDDRTGQRFAGALRDAARRGVKVRVLYDWLGCKSTSGRYWRALREAGIEVLAFKPPRFADLFGNLGRNHRKVIVADGEEAVIGGLCIGDEWEGDATHGVAPWRDTALSIRGPAAGALALTFHHAWQVAGGRVPADEPMGSGEPAGPAAIRVISSLPGRARIARLIELLAAGAVNRLWITDAYTVVLPQLRSALQDSARAGVDVRLLVPGASDLPLVRNLTRFGYGDLLRAGVRIYEWDGPMLHAKCVVADTRWARVGSSNLNPSSFLGNWELDVLVEDDDVADALEGQFRRDLARSSEVGVRPRRFSRLQEFDRVLPTRYGRTAPEIPIPAGHRRMKERGYRAGRTLRSVMAGARRSLFGPLSGFLLLIAGLFIFLPQAMAVVAALLCAWLGVSAAREALRRRSD